MTFFTLLLWIFMCFCFLITFYQEHFERKPSKALIIFQTCLPLGCAQRGKTIKQIPKIDKKRALLYA